MYEVERIYLKQPVIAKEFTPNESLLAILLGAAIFILVISTGVSEANVVEKSGTRNNVSTRLKKESRRTEITVISSAVEISI
jgi:hypothetical protein